MVKKAIVTALAVLGALGTPASAQKIEGFATAVDGDTIEMTGTIIRLAHIDAPETDQTCLREESGWNCGQEATDELASLLEGQRVTCRVANGSALELLTAECETDAFPLGPEMVRRGLAILPGTAPYSYVEAAQIAQRLRYGLWASTFELPSQWRDAHPEKALEAVQPEPPAGTQQSTQLAPNSWSEPIFRNEYGCAIKGNRSRRGEWIYHLPGRPYYEQTRPEELFCTESDARAAGYRRSKA